MYRWPFVFIIIFIFTTGVVIAQDTGTEGWKTSSDGSLEYNCQIFATILSDKTQLNALLDQIVVRNQSGQQLTLQEFVGTITSDVLSQNPESTVSFDSIFGDVQSICGASTNDVTANSATQVANFVVIANGNANLRSCPSTDCSVVGAVSKGETLTVIGTSGTWYQVQHGTISAFISSPLTSRGPDATIQIDQPYFDQKTGCAVVFDVKRGDPDITILLTGSHQSETFADLYRPNEAQPLHVAGQLDKTFIDTGEAYIYQYYPYYTGWPQGIYQLELTFNEQTSKLAWELKEQGDYLIYVECGTS